MGGWVGGYPDEGSERRAISREKTETKTDIESDVGNGLVVIREIDPSAISSLVKAVYKLVACTKYR
jgi:hypothetical protein